ncbi:MFS transporter [Achromobacter insuavis]
MVSGSLTDLYGPRRVWLGGLAWFCAFTFPIAWAPSAGWIDFLRLMQGVGGAAAFAAAMSSLAPLFHGAARARAFSLLGTTFGIGLSFGPLISGWLVQTAGWRWVFHGTGLVGLAGLALVAASVRATAGGPAAASTGAARSVSPARWGCSLTACCSPPKTAGPTRRWPARCWPRRCWASPSSAPNSAPRTRCWTCRCSAARALSACRRWRRRRHFCSSR